MWLKLTKNIDEIHRRSQDFWLGGKTKPQITRNDVFKVFRKKGLFTGQRCRRMEDQKLEPGLACNLGFAKEKGLKPKVKKISKIVLVGRRGEQTSLAQTYRRRWSGGRHWAIFRNFFLEKNNYFNAIWITFCKLLELFKITKFLRLESQLKQSNWWIFPSLKD